MNTTIETTSGRTWHLVRLSRERCPNWNEAGAWLTEHVGLPGQLWHTHFNQRHIDFWFSDTRDQLLFTLAWGNDGHQSSKNVA